MSDRQPWFCPSCQKHHGPHVDTCPAPTVVMPGSVPTFTWPVPTTAAGFDLCPGCKGACGNVACPKLLVTTCEAH